MTDYVAQSKHNKKTHDFLNTKTPEYRDWEITTLFYAALHAVNRHFESRGIKVPTNHGARRSLVRHKLPAVYEPYMRLRVLSERSRYKGLETANDACLESALKSYSKIRQLLA